MFIYCNLHCLHINRETFTIPFSMTLHNTLKIIFYFHNRHCNKTQRKYYLLYCGTRKDKILVK